jgi:hypothetical protein
MATLVTRNVNEVLVAPMMVPGGVCVLRDSGVLCHAVVLCWCVWQNLASVTAKMFTYLTYIVNLYTLFDCGLYKDGAAQNSCQL